MCAFKKKKTWVHAQPHPHANTPTSIPSTPTQPIQSTPTYNKPTHLQIRQHPAVPPLQLLLLRLPLPRCCRRRGRQGRQRALGLHEPPHELARLEEAHLE